MTGSYKDKTIFVEVAISENLAIQILQLVHWFPTSFVQTLVAPYPVLTYIYYISDKKTNYLFVDLEEYFNLSCNIKTGICLFTAKELKYSELKDHLPLELLLTIECEDKDASASLIITGKREKIEFAKPLYVATYNPDDDTILFDDSIEFNNQNKQPNIDISSSKY